MKPPWMRWTCLRESAGETMFTVSPSIYSADMLDLKTVLDRARNFEHIHLDIDDGNFVRGISFGTDLAAQIASYTDVPLDAHLEVLNPLDYVEALAKADIGLITAHIEALDYPSMFISTVHSFGKKAGLALTKSNRFDLIVSFFIENGRYDIFELNDVLFEYDLPLLGC